MILDDNYVPQANSASSSSTDSPRPAYSTSTANWGGPLSPPPSYAPLSYPASLGSPMLSADKPPTFAPSDSNVSSQSLHLEVPSPTSYYHTPSSASSSQLRSPEPPLPSSFGRVPPPNLSYEPFEPLYLIARGATLDKGFPPAPPPTVARVHPFVSHDIGEGDWLSFLREMQTSATLTEKDIVKSHLALISKIPVLDPLCALGVQKYMKNRKRHKVVKDIETWNHHFFKLRKVYIVLMRGKNPLNGPMQLKFSSSKSTPSWNIEDMAADWGDDEYRLLLISV